jgi:predicted dehydrogenase
MVQSVLSGAPPVCTAEDSVYALSVCLAALRSIETGQAVAVEG